MSIMLGWRKLETRWITWRFSASSMAHLNISFDKRYRNWPQMKSECLARVRATVNFSVIAAKSFSFVLSTDLTQEIMMISFSVPWNPSTVLTIIWSHNLGHLVMKEKISSWLNLSIRIIFKNDFVSKCFSSDVIFEILVFGGRSFKLLGKSWNT